MNPLSSGIQAGGQIAGGVINGAFGMAMQKRQQKYTQENMDKAHQQNEESADNADKRKRAFYTDFESPEAVMRQLKNAGLSPGLFYGGSGTGGMGASGGAQAASGGALPGAGFTNPGIGDAISGLGMALSQIELNKAEARNLNADADTKEGKNTRGALELQNLEQEITVKLKDIESKEADIAYTRQQTAYSEAMTIAQKTTNDMTTEAWDDIRDEYRWRVRNMIAEHGKIIAETENSKADAQTKNETRELLKTQLREQVNEIQSRISLNLSQERVNAEEITKIQQMVLTLQAQTENEKRRPEWFKQELETRLEQTKMMKSAMLITAGMNMGGKVIEGLIDIFAPVKGLGKALQGTTTTPMRGTYTTNTYN